MSWGTGGVATYPSIIPPMEDYTDTLKLAAHEWLHQYLFFQPLGAHYYDSDTLRTINETVADIAGEEMGELVAQRYPLPPPAGQPPEEQPPSAPPGDDTFFVSVMRQLRLDVDRLLGEGRDSGGGGLDGGEASILGRQRLFHPQD